MRVYLAVVIGLSILIMIVVFRSLLVPLIATGGFLLSFFAALAASMIGPWVAPCWTIFSAA